MSDYISCRQLAELLGVSERTIRKWEADGTIPPAYRTSKRWCRWKRSEVEAKLAKDRDRLTR